MSADHYAILSLPYNATAEEIRGVYFQLARSLHPDVNPDPAVREQFLAIQRAYEVLSNPVRKAAYDANLPAELRHGPEIAVSVKYSQAVFPSLNEPQLAYALVDLVCTAEANPEYLPPCHVCLVLDRSTSMQGVRMDMVKASAFNLLQQLRPRDYISVVSFSDRAEVVVPATRASSLSKYDHRISQINTGGGTEIMQGLSAGVQQLRLSNSDGMLRHLILLTDGRTYGDEQACLQLAREAAAEGISISVIGLGHEWNDDLMDKISGMSGANAMFISDAQDLNQFFQQKLIELGMVYARSLMFHFESAADVKLRYAFRLTPNTGPMDITSPISLGDAQYRKSISFLLEFLMPPMTTDLDRLNLARGQVWMEIPARPAPRARILLDLHRPVKSSVQAAAPPSIILEAMSKLTLYRMQERVRREVIEGQIEKATKHLHYLATHLLSQGDRELAHTVLIEAEHVQQTHRFSGEGEKRIKYGTRALLLPPGPELKL